MFNEYRGVSKKEMELDKDEYYDVVTNIEKDLRYISGIIKQKGRELLSDYSITLPQFIALQWLFDEGDMTIGELSTKMYLAFSTTTDLIDRMEKNSLVKRVRDENDRRVIRVHLLQEGKKLIDEVIKKRQAYLRELFQDYSQEDLVQIQNNLMRLHHDMR